jgi:hypothetical protein
MRRYARRVTDEPHHQFGIRPTDLLQPRSTNCGEDHVLDRHRGGRVGTMTEQRNVAEQVTLPGSPYGPFLVIDLSMHRHGASPLRLSP